VALIVRTGVLLILGSLAVVFLGTVDSDARRNMIQSVGRLAYSNSNVCLVNADGSGRRCLTHTGDVYSSVEWSADGRHLAFERSRDDPGPGNRDSVWVIGSDGRHLVNLTPSGMEDGFPAWSPVAPRIAFARIDRAGTRLDGIYVANADGTRARRVVADAFATGPSWSPDGDEIAFVRYPRGTFVADASGGKLRRITRKSASEVVAWSPNGRRLLLVLETSLDAHIYVANASGGALRRLTRRCREDFAPAWSSDGRKVAFVCQRKANAVFTVNSDGTSLRAIAPPGTSYPAWSPDGQWLAYLGDGIQVMHVDSTARRRVVASTLEIGPTWDPSRS
jgi:Tol biopolymer transport system component